MAIDPRIPLGIQAPDLGRAVLQGQQMASNALAIKGQKQATEANRLMGLAAGAQGGEADAALQKLLQLDPAKGIQFQKTLRDNKQAISKEFITESALQSVDAVQRLEAGDFAGAHMMLQRQIKQAEQYGIDPTDGMSTLKMIEAGDIKGAIADLQNDLMEAERRGYLKPLKGAGPRSAAAKEQADLNDGYITADGLAQYRAGKGTNVNIVNEAEGKGLTEEQKALAKSRVSRFEGLQNTAQSAMDQNEVLSQLESMDVKTGFGEGAKTTLARVFNAAGADGDALLGVDAANAQAFTAMTGKLLAEALAAQKGPQTDSDAARMEKTIASLGNEPRANTFIVTSMKAVNERKVEQAAFYEQVLEEDGTLKDADKKWREYKNSTPLLTDNIEDAETGLPMFYYDFKRKALERNPSADEDQILDAWRELAK